MISEILRKELERFEKTKAKEISKSLKEYAKENMDTTVQVHSFSTLFFFSFLFLPPQVPICDASLDCRSVEEAAQPAPECDTLG